MALPPSFSVLPFDPELDACVRELIAQDKAQVERAVATGDWSSCDHTFLGSALEELGISNGIFFDVRRLSPQTADELDAWCN